MMGRKKEKEKSPQSPVHRFLGRNSGPAKPKVANVSVDGAQNGGLRLRYYGQTDTFAIAGGPDPRGGGGQNGGSGVNSSSGNPGAMATSSFTTFGVPSQPQPTSGSSSSVSSASVTSSSGIREYQPPRAANLLSFQASPMQSPAHSSSCHDDDDEEEDSVSSISNGTPPIINGNQQGPGLLQMRSLIPVSAQVHRPNSIEKSQSEEDLNGAVNGAGESKAVENGQNHRDNKEEQHEPLSDGIVREKTPVHMRRHSTGENLGNAGSPPRTVSPIAESSKSGNRSPGSQSLVSITSTATVISTSGGLDAAGREARGKQTLGDILGQIEQRAKNLLSKTKFTTTEVLPDLQYLAHQSRYSSDAAIKRRITQKLIECNVVQIFVRVFKSVHSVDYLAMEEEGGANGGGANGGGASEDGAVVSSSKVASVSKSSVDSVGSGASSNASIDAATGSSSGSSGGGVGAAGGGPVAAGKPIGKPPAAGQSHNDKNHCTDAMKNLRAVITILWNTTEKLGQLPVCEDCVHQGVVTLILSELGEPGFVSTELGKDQNKLYLVKGYLGILQNILRFFSDGREAFRSAGAVKILQQYLKSSLLMVKTRTIMLLSHIMSESENDIINASDKNLGFVVKMLQSAVEGENHYSKKYGFWAVEAAAGLNRLASLESNKARIVGKGALPLYAQLLLPPCSEEESLVAAKGLWILSFNHEARAQIKADAGCMDGLQQLEAENGREEIRKMASGALWLLSNKNVPSPAVMEQAAASEESPTAHVLVSYQWTSKHMVSRIRELLRSAGYKVCTDVEPAAGTSIMAAMSECVNKAAVVLLCMSQKYKDSPSCRTEAEYARDANKVLIPLRLQPKYNPDGWLADIVGSKLFFDLSRMENVEKMIPNLIREMGKRGRLRSMDSLAATGAVGGGVEEYRRASPVLRRSVSPLPPPVQLQEQCIQVSPEEADRSLGAWSKEDVTKWLKARGLHTDKLKQMDGELLVQLRKLRRDAPEIYHTMLRSDLKFDFMTILRFNNALEKL